MLSIFRRVIAASHGHKHIPLVIRLLAIFFALGALVCGLTFLLLLFPGTLLGQLWQLNPEAHSSLQSIGGMAVPLLVAIGLGCAVAAIGLARGAQWGRSLTILILLLNLFADLEDSIRTRHVIVLWISVPVAGAVIFYLLSEQADRAFKSSVEP
jgi:hypothetical protein